MNSKRAFFIMLAVVILLGIGIIGATVLGDQLLQKESGKLVGLKLDSKLLDDQQTSLIQANKDIAKYSDLENIAKSVVPQEKDQAQTVREIVNIASQSGIKLSAISFPASTLGQPVAPATPGNTTSGSSTPAPAAPSITQVTPVKSISGVYVMEINIQQDNTSPISYDSFINFLDKLEHNRRTAQVTSVSVTPNPQDSSKLSFNIVVDVYIKPWK